MQRVLPLQLIAVRPGSDFLTCMHSESGYDYSKMFGEVLGRNAAMSGIFIIHELFGPSHGGYTVRRVTDGDFCPHNTSKYHKG